MKVHFGDAMLVFAAAYPLFWIQSIVPSMTVFVIGANGDERQGVMLRDEPPSLFSASAVICSIVAVVVTQPVSSVCDLHATAGHSLSFGIAVLVVAVYAKCLFGAAGEGVKRVELGSDGRIRRPLKLRLLDSLTSLVIAATDRLAWIVVVIPCLAAVIAVGANLVGGLGQS